jgi:hypothetical protein
MENEDDQEKLYELLLDGDGIKIKRKIPETLAREIMHLVMGGAIGANKTQALSGLKSLGSGSRLSLREFIEEAGAKRNPEKIVAIGAYITQQLQQENFSRKEVKLQFKNAGEPVPGNYTRDFNWAISIGWLAPVPSSPKDYFVTNKGFEAINNQFSSEIRQKTKLSRRSRKKQRKNEDA